MSSQENKNPEMADSLKYKIYNILYQLLNHREDTIKQFKLDYNITAKKEFPRYEIPWISYWMQKAERLVYGR